VLGNGRLVTPAESGLLHGAPGLVRSDQLLDLRERQAALYLPLMDRDGG